MANEKILNTRVQLKYDTLANWNASTFIPKKGEMCIATVDTAQKDAKGNIVTVPTLLIKVGSGSAPFAALPFVSAPAADVYDWAKKTIPDPSDFPWLTSFIQGAIKDTNTTYTFARGKDAEGKDNNTLVVTPSEGNPVTISLAPTGYVTTARKFSFQYGRLEFRARLPESVRAALSPGITDPFRLPE